MSAIYDNWERLVGATLRREQLRQLTYADSLSSGSTDFSSRLSDSVSEIEARDHWGYNDNNSKTVQRNFKAEKSDLVPGHIFVNGKPLNRTELDMLLKCPNPPKKLKAGNYWYDIGSGLWGKQGQKPSEIICARLQIGFPLERHASNGNTQVHVNGREITKMELRMLKYAGVRCHRGIHLWMTEDGSYQEEGMHYVKGKIWSKVGMKLICSLLSLPVPPKYSDIYGEQIELDNGEQIELKTIQKLLLIGCSGSGKSTILKQAISLYKEITILEDELERVKLLIQTNLYGYICILVQGHIHYQEKEVKESRIKQSSDKLGLTGSAVYADAIHESIIQFGPRFEAFFDWLHVTESLDISSTSFIEAFAPVVEELLRNLAFQETIERRSELPSDVHFLERAECIFKPDYKPSCKDILYAEGTTSLLSFMEFSFPSLGDDEADDGDQHDSTIRYGLMTSTADNFEGNAKLLEVSEDVQIVIFCISLSDYDQFVIDERGSRVNKMVYYKNCFERVVKNPIFSQIGFLLLLTKYDLFEKKIKRSPLSQCDWFNNFRPVPSRYYDGEKGFQYISVKFMRLYTALTGRKLYVAKVNCLEQDSVDAALKYAREIIKWEEEMIEYLYTDSDYSSD